MPANGGKDWFVRGILAYGNSEQDLADWMVAVDTAIETGGSGGGLSQAQVDARVALVTDPLDTRVDALELAPPAHTHPNTAITGLGTSSTRDVPSAGNASSAQVVLGDDTRLSDARTPTTHSHVINDVTNLQTELTSLDGRLDALEIAPPAHTHPNTAITGLGTSSTLDVPAAGDASAAQVVKGNDTRLTNARTPTAHSHVIADVTSLQTSLDTLTSADTTASARILRVERSAGIPAIWRWVASTATAGLQDGNTAAAQTAGTFAVQAPAATNRWVMRNRSRYSSVVTTTNQNIGVNANENVCFLSGSAGLGGFYAEFFWGFNTWLTNDRFFAGLSAAAYSGANTVLALTSCVGFGADTGDTTIRLWHNDSSGNNVPETITGAPTLASGQGYRGVLSSAAGSNTVQWELYRLDSGTSDTLINSGSVSTELPAAATLLRPSVRGSNASNIVANDFQLEIAGFYVSMTGL